MVFIGLVNHNSSIEESIYILSTTQVELHSPLGFSVK